MNVFSGISFFIILFAIVMASISLLNIADILSLHDEVTVEGTVIDSEYSASGYGSSDITVLHFESGRTLILRNVVEVNLNTPLILVYKDLKYSDHKILKSIEYL